ncbi:MAG: FAD-binding protein [Myxococcota bacterium]
MVCPPDSSRTRISIRGRDWENFSATVRYTIPRYLQARDLDDLVWVTSTAEAAGERVKALGSGWSIENIATSEDWVVNTDGLNRRLEYLVDRTPGLDALTDFWRRRQREETGERLVHVEAGIKIIDLNRRLEADGLAMPTLGGAQGQTLAGAFSTGTHGSDLDYGPIADLIQAVHLVTTGGQEVWIESASSPITNDDDVLRSILPCADTQIIRDDEALAAVLVGLGRFGIVYSVVAKVTRAFRLSEWTQSRPWARVKERLLGTVGRPASDGSPLEGLNTLLDNPPWDLRISTSPVDYRYLDITFNPRKGGDCWVRRRWVTREDGDINLEAGSNFLCHPTISNAILMATAGFLRGYAALITTSIPIAGGIKAIEVGFRAAELTTRALDPHLTGGAALAAAANAIWASEFGIPVGWMIDEINQIALSDTFGPSSSEGKRGPSWQVTSGQNESGFDRDCYNGSSIEVVFGMDTRAYIDFIDEVLANSNRFRQLGYVSVRFSRKSKALLSMHNANYHMACSIEVTSLHDVAESRQWLIFLEQRAKELGGRPHWGQHNQMRSWEVVSAYGDNLIAWRDQLLRIVGPSLTFSNEFTTTRGLEPQARDRHITAVHRDGGAITQLCGDGYWSPVPIETAITDVLLGRVRYYTTAPDGSARQNLQLRRFVSTSPDETAANNLENLPDATTVYGPPPEDRRELRVTSVTRTDDFWRTVRFLCNEAEGWCVHFWEAFTDIRNGTRTYYVEEDGARSDLVTHEFLTTQADATEMNNLGSLPDC